MTALPLSGLVVLDLTWHAPGAFASLLLADQGADVVKVEPPEGDPLRSVPPLVEGTSAYFLALNRNKRSVVADLKTPEGRAAVHELAGRSEVVLEGFRPGVAERLGIGYETLAARNPALVCCRLSAFGQGAPLGGLPAHDPNHAALSGLLDLNGDADRAPVLLPIQVADLVGGALTAAVGTLSAIIAARASGHGTLVDVSMLDGTFALLGMHLAAHFAGLPAERGRMPFSGGYAWCDVYTTADDRHVTICPLEPRFWKELCELLGLAHRIEAQYDPDPAVQAALRRELADVFARRTRREWTQLLGDRPVGYSEVRTLAEAADDPLLRERGMIVTDADGRIVGAGNPIKFWPAASGAPNRPAPLLGEHNEELLGTARPRS